jgi:hypothetical protein
MFTTVMWVHAGAMMLAFATLAGHCGERLIGSIRRECVDHIIVLGEAHLRRILKSYARYYNGTRIHSPWDKNAPVSRPVQRTGVVRSLAVLGGLHHHYARA